MKKVLILIASIALCVNVFAQSSVFNNPTEGYRGFAGLNIFNGVGDYCFDRFAITTTHGFQSDKVFVGMGASMQFALGEQYFYDEDDEEIDNEFMMPFFLDLNYDFQSDSKSLAPFADLKVGYSVGDANGLYVLPSIGLRVAHINIWAGYNLVQDKYTKYSYYDKKTEGNRYFHSIAFGVFFDWGARNN